MMTPVNTKASGTSTAAGPSENPWDTINQVVAQALGTKIQGRHISNHNLANRLFLANQKLGQSMGLSEDVLKQVTPFPSPTNNTFILNENPNLADLLTLLTAQPQPKPEQSQPEPITPAPPTATQAPAPASKWPRWLWPLVASLGIAGSSALTTWAMWPESPPDVNADLEVTAR